MVWTAASAAPARQGVDHELMRPALPAAAVGFDQRRLLPSWRPSPGASPPYGQVADWIGAYGCAARCGCRCVVSPCPHRSLHRGRSSAATEGQISMSPQPAKGQRWQSSASC